MLFQAKWVKCHVGKQFLGLVILPNMLNSCCYEEAIEELMSGAPKGEKVFYKIKSDGKRVA